MLDKSDRYILVLLSAMVAADAGAGGVSPRKKAALDAVLRARYPELDGKARWALVGRALRDIPINGGLNFLRLLERLSGKLASQLTSKRDAFELLQQLAVIAESNGRVSPPERLVFQTITNSIGLAGRVTVTYEDDRIALVRRRRSA